MTNEPEKPKPTPRERLRRALRTPEALVGLLAMVGVTSEQAMPVINAVIDADLPGWAVLAGVAGYMFIRWGVKVVDSLVAIIGEFRAFRDETLERLTTGDGLFEEINAWREVTDDRLDAFEGELEAYREKTKRETGKVPQEPPDA